MVMGPGRSSERLAARGGQGRLVPSFMQQGWRIIDANANRAREGLRVIEDVARFVLEDAALAERCKRVRHLVTRAIAMIGGDAIRELAWRDAVGDVGAGIKVDAELARADLAGVVGANAGRATEALRVLAELMKVQASIAGMHAANEAHALIEAARYEVYEIERATGLALGAGDKFQPRVCVLISERLCVHHAWEQVAGLALAAGTEMIQLREKDLSDRELLARAQRLVAMCREHGARCVINDRPDIAMLAGAWGVHVGQGDMPIRDIRRLAGRSLRVGVSTENMSQALEAVASGADQCGVGPMFVTTTKEKQRIAGPSYVREYVGTPSTARVPHLAIGGITPANVSDLVAAGCLGIAVSSVVCGASEPDEMVGKLVKAMSVS